MLTKEDAIHEMGNLLTEDQAVGLTALRWWEFPTSVVDAVLAQLLQMRLCMPVETYVELTSQVLGRDISQSELQSGASRVRLLLEIYRTGPAGYNPGDAWEVKALNNGIITCSIWMMKGTSAAFEDTCWLVNDGD